MRAAALVLTLLLAAPAAADEVVLANGRTLEGRASRVGDEVIVRGAAGEVRLRAAEVTSIRPGPTKDDLYRERLGKLDAKDVAQQVALADWCRDQGLRDLERKHLAAVVAIDPDHEAARARLGHLRHDGRWMTEDEYRAARGFVREGGAWVSREEASLREERRRAQAALDAHVKRIRECVVRMSSPRRKVRAEGKVALQRYAEERGDAPLARWASDVAAFYNERWRAVKAEWVGATALTTVRATHSQLQRPIRTFETSLGAFSTPVRIQLPELSVVSVKTTVRVPVAIELDEE